MEVISNTLTSNGFSIQIQHMGDDSFIDMS